ncbi:MAG: 4-phosphopantetheinyl transferase family protein [bacterium]|nr:4-phosphopantetheinyl transferase family protein [bacterium]MCP5069985.1 4-phosphopantetheinyl transferase family protein [bacterium]
MIGNDVVDLGDPEAQPAGRHPRWDARVFSALELDALRKSGAPDRLRWIFWAAKEAAYKVARKLDRRTVFSPPRFEVQLDATLRGHVSYPGGTLPVMVDEARNRLHAIASDEEPGKSEMLVQVVAWDGDAELASKALRARVRRELATHFELSAEDLEIDRIGRIPVVLAAGRPVDVDLSLSHHGGFVAFACDLREGAGDWWSDIRP